MAAEFLKENGYVIVETNYRCHAGEIDIIALNERFLCFIEVKYRKDSHLGDPLEAINYAKQRRIINAASCYLKEHRKMTCHKCRFDAVGIMPGGIRLVKNAFGGM